jgi:hypothetical protein
MVPIIEVMARAQSVKRASLTDAKKFQKELVVFIE